MLKKQNSGRSPELSDFHDNYIGFYKMVKDFIKGVFKKKDKSEESKNADPNVPDELPPLAEDTVKKTESPQSSTVPFVEVKQGTTFKEPADIPQELPSITIKSTEDTTTMKSQQTDSNTTEAVATSGETDSDSIVEDTPKREDASISKSAVTISATELPKDISTKGFFSNILRHIRHHGVVKDKLLSGDIFSRMSNYWELRKNEIRTGVSLSEEQRIEQEMIKELTELQILESKWQIQKMAIEDDLRYLHQRERDIQLKVEGLKRIANEMKLFHNVPPESYFYLYNGVIIKNLHEMIEALEIMEEDTFRHHVNDKKNDFAEWINNVVKDKGLAEKVYKSKTRDEIINLLETEPVRFEEMIPKKQLAPADYFWLANGVVIKDLYELADALRIIDDKTFNIHISSNKNDFSNWIGNIYNNKYLADKLSHAKSREEMISLLDVFL